MQKSKQKPVNKVGTIHEALSYIHDGSTLMFGGFGGIGNPPTLIDAILEKGIKDLTLIGNDAAFPDIGIGRIVSRGLAKKIIASHIGSNPVAGQLMTDGKLEVEFSPQGTLAERIRAGGVGLKGILVDVGLGSMVEEGKQKVTVDGKTCILETPLRAEVSIVYAKKADTFGNLVYDTSARNTSPLVAMAGDYTIVEVEEIVPAGELDPECVVTPGIFVDMIIQSKRGELDMGMGVDLRNRMARRAAKEIDPGMIVNLGIGIPSLVSNHIPTDMQVMFQAENGVLGMGESPEEGEENPMLCNAAGFPVSIVPGASYFDSATAFGIIRSGNLDITILGGLEVSEKGDLANWIVPGKRVPGIGGAMELAQKAKKVIVLMSHVNKHGEPKIVPECQLPLTAKACVDIIITDRAVIEVTEKGLLLKEVMAPYTADDVMKHTAAELMLSDQVTTLS